MKILVTGCFGFIGSHVCKYLLNRGDTVFGMDIDWNEKMNDLVKYPNFILVRKEDSNIINTNFLASAEIKIDAVCHLAALCGVRHSLTCPEDYFNVNVVGFTHLLDECVKQGVKRFVFASSSSVYGENSKVPFEETDPLDNVVSPYALTKKQGEEIAELYSKLHNVTTIGLRFFTVYGPRGRKDMAPYKFMNAILNNGIITKFGKGDNTYRDYTYIDDIVDGIVKSIDYSMNQEIGFYEVFNLGSEKPIILNDFITACEIVCGKKAEIVEYPPQKGDVKRTYASTDKAQKILKYRPKFDLEMGLELYKRSLGKEGSNIASSLS